MTTLVTGGAGFIGSNLASWLRSDGRDVVCLDDLSSGRRGNVADLVDDPSFSLVVGDVCDPIAPTLSDAGHDPSTIDRIYHLASRASPKHFEQYPLDIALTNTEGTRRVLEFAREHSSRVVYASTSEIYGEPEVHPQPESYNGNVDPRGERACYDEAKRFGETLSTVYHEEYGVDARTVRIFNTYGPKMAPDDGRVVPNFVTQALDGRDLTIYGDGTQTRSFLYVADLVDALSRLMDRDGLANVVVNVGSTDEITIRELADHVIDAVDCDVGTVHEPMPPGDPSRRQPDISRARELLDWEPTVDLEAGLSRTVEHFASDAA